MKREHRYIILKIKDTSKYLSEMDHRLLGAMMDKVNFGRTADGKPPLKCACVEHDWPEYEEVWKMIATRVDGVAGFKAGFQQAKDYPSLCEDEGCPNSHIPHVCVEKPAPVSASVPERSWSADGETVVLKNYDKHPYYTTPQIAGPSGDTLSDFRDGQWWVKELDAVVANGTNDQRRAVAVVRNLLATIAMANTHGADVVDPRDHDALDARTK